MHRPRGPNVFWRFQSAQGGDWRGFSGVGGALDWRFGALGANSNFCSIRINWSRGSRCYIRSDSQSGWESQDLERFKEDVQPWLETEKPDVDYSLGARLLRKLTGPAKSFGKTAPSANLGRALSGSEAHTTRARITRGATYLMDHLESLMSVDASDRWASFKLSSITKYKDGKGNPQRSGLQCPKER